MLMLDTMRAEFARFLSDNASTQFSMDKALAHVVTLAYERGLDDGRRNHVEVVRDLSEAMRDVFPVAHRLALELECLIMSTNDTAAVSKWWDSANEALEQWWEFCREDAQKVGADGTEVQS